MTDVNLRWDTSKEVLDKVMASTSISDRNKRITFRVLHGELIHDVAFDYDITRERVRQIALKSIKQTDCKLAFSHLYSVDIDADKFQYLFDMDLGVRGRNCIINEGFSKLELIAVIETKEGQRKMFQVPNFGRKSLGELCAALDMPMLI